MRKVFSKQYTNDMKKVTLLFYFFPSMETYNAALMDAGGEQYALHEKTALGTLSVSVQDADELYNALIKAYEIGAEHGYKDGELYVTHETSSTRKRWMAYAGFSTYALNHGDKDDQNGNRQKKCTTVVPGKDLTFLCNAIPAIRPLANMAREYACMDIAFIDILRQSSTGEQGGKESLFDWHRDNDGDRAKVRLTIIFLLTNTKTSMQVCGFDEMHYGEQGSGVAFMSKMWHRSCFAEAGTMKIAFFMAGKMKRTQNKSWHQCICGKLDPPIKKRGWIEETWYQCDNGKCSRWCHGFCANKQGIFKDDMFYCSSACCPVSE